MRLASAPDPGDLSVCVNCASPLIFEADMTLRRLTAAEFDELEPEMRNTLRAYMGIARAIDRTGGSYG